MARLALLFVALGAVLRVWKFLERPGLWVDEAMVAINIGGRSFAGLVSPLDFTQLAPVPWLWLEKLVVLLGGMHELALRSPALIAGLCLPWLVWRAGTHLIGENGALVATALVATGSSLIFFSAETKPYATDAATAALLLFLAGRCLTKPLDDRSLHTLGAVGLGAMLFSFPAVFTLGAIGIALLARAILARQTRSAVTIGAWGGAWLLAFVLPQLTVYREMAGGVQMQSFWEPAMARIGEPGFMSRASTAVNALLETLAGLQVWPGSELFLIILAVGAWAVARKRGLVTMLVVTVPLPLLGIAWLLDQIPANDRLLLFAAPTLALLFGAAVGEALHRVPFRRRGAAAAVATVFLGALMVTQALRGLRRQKSSGGRELVARIASEPSTPVWMTRWGMPVWLFYTTDWSAPDRARLDWYAAQARRGWLQRGAPVLDDGAGRVRTEGSRLVRIAGPSGVRSVAGVLQDAGVVDAWAANEVKQLLPLADARPLLLMIHEKPPEHAAMVRAIAAAGLTVDSVAAEKRSTLWRLEPNGQAPSAVSTSSIEPQR